MQLAPNGATVALPVTGISAHRSVMPGQRDCYGRLATVRRVGVSPSLSPPADEGDVTAENIEGAGGADEGEPPRRLPPRPVSDRLPVQRIRRMDDPEILQRVLEGLINLT
jgi:hypothetical protein